MKNPSECLDLLKKNSKTEWKVAFLSAFFAGLLIHLPAWMQDVPNHDGLASIYFDQNMITSGRWFLTVACGVSSYFTLPWLIGLLSLLCLSLTSVFLSELLDVQRKEWIALIGILLVAFPSLASTYAYIFTADGYMFALFLAVLAVWMTKRLKGFKGILFGGICLAFSMGTYQAYLSFCILLCLYVILQYFLENDTSFKDKCYYLLRYLGMGVWGVGLYYILLQILLKVEGKVLDTYQGINDMTAVGGSSLPQTIQNMYRDFFVFLGKGNIVANNVLSLLAVLLLGGLVVYTLCRLVIKRKLYQSIGFWTVLLVFAAVVPLSMNVILFISPGVGYHLLMRYQYVLLLILGIAFVERYCFESGLGEENASAIAQWLLLAAGIVLCVNYGVSDNIGYSNLQKRYEKTYAYCLRLADRIEQTEGYETGMPVVLMGIVGNENFPNTDITEKVTGNMIGLCGDYLCYTGQNYQDFFKNYLGISIEIVEQEEVGRIYNTSAVYQELDSFPGANSTRVVDGVLYVKTENQLAREDWPETVILP